MDALDARTGAAHMTARLERAVQSAAPRAWARTVECQHLRVRPPGAKMRALADDNVVGVHDHSTDDRIGGRAATAARGVKERALHPHTIVRARHHFSVNSAST